MACLRSEVRASQTLALGLGSEVDSLVGFRCALVMQQVSSVKEVEAASDNHTIMLDC